MVWCSSQEQEACLYTYAAYSIVIITKKQGREGKVGKAMRKKRQWCRRHRMQCRRTVGVNGCGVDEVEVRQKGLWTMVGQCELRKVETKERAKNWSVRVSDGGDLRSDIDDVSEVRR